MATAYGGVLSYAAAPYSYSDTPRDRIAQMMMGAQNPSGLGSQFSAAVPPQYPPQQFDAPSRPDAEFGIMTPPPPPDPINPQQQQPLGPAGGFNAPGIRQRRF